MEKNENLMKYEEQLKAMKDSTIILQEALKKQRSGGTWSSETAMLEEEWMRRFNETREMYEEAIQGYKDQLEQTQRKVVLDEQDHAQQIEELRRQLQKAQTQLKAIERNRLEETRMLEDEQEHAREGGGERADQMKGNQNGVMGMGSPGHQIAESDGCSSPKDLAGTALLGSPKHSKEDTQSAQPQATAMGQDKEGEGKPESATATRTEEMYSEALSLIVKRLESLQVGRGEVEGMMGIIKDTINTCLQEWRDSFQQTRAQQDENKNQLQHENEELQRKLRTRSKKIETLQKQNEDQQQQNEKLRQQCSLLESQVSVTFRSIGEQ